MRNHMEKERGIGNNLHQKRFHPFARGNFYSENNHSLDQPCMVRESLHLWVFFRCDLAGCCMLPSWLPQKAGLNELWTSLPIWAILWKWKVKSWVSQQGCFVIISLLYCMMQKWTRWESFHFFQPLWPQPCLKADFKLILSSSNQKWSTFPLFPRFIFLNFPLIFFPSFCAVCFGLVWFGFVFCKLHGFKVFLFLIYIQSNAFDFHRMLSFSCI